MLTSICHSNLQVVEIYVKHNDCDPVITGMKCIERSKVYSMGKIKIPSMCDYCHYSKCHILLSGQVQISD